MLLSSHLSTPYQHFRPTETIQNLLIFYASGGVDHNRHFHHMSSCYRSCIQACSEYVRVSGRSWRIDLTHAQNKRRFGHGMCLAYAPERLLLPLRHYRPQCDVSLATLVSTTEMISKEPMGLESSKPICSPLSGRVDS